jgi:fused signal recognition particle receptor
VGLLSRLTDSLKRTKDQLFQRFEEVVQQADAPEARTRTSVPIDTLEALEEVLISADVGVGATNAIVKAVGARARRGESLRSLVKAEITAILEGADTPAVAVAPPRVVMIVGVNGTGKTTTVGKLARALKTQGKDPLVCAADTFRAAAVEQLSTWGERVGVPVVKQATGADPAAVAFDAAEAAVARGADVLLVDTAGRLHTQVNLMKELEKISRVIGKKIPGAPHECLLVLDATTGQNALHQVKIFREAVPVSGLFLAKMDGTARGGVVFAIRREIRVPVKFIGVGEKFEDIERFDPRSFVDALFGEGA